MSDENEFYPFAELCKVCGGTGIDDPAFDGWDDVGWIECAACNGQGLIFLEQEQPDVE